jgi:hypothetical protein
LSADMGRSLSMQTARASAPGSFGGITMPAPKERTAAKAKTDAEA